MQANIPLRPDLRILVFVIDPAQPRNLIPCSTATEIFTRTFSRDLPVAAIVARNSPEGVQPFGRTCTGDDN